MLSRAAPDGHTLGLVSVGHPVNAAFYRMPYDTIGSFSFITQTTSTPLALVAAKSFGPSTPRELAEHAKKNPGTTFAGTSGVVRLAPVLFAQAAGVEMEYVPYRGSTAAHPDLISGRVAIMFDTVPAALPCPHPVRRAEMPGDHGGKPRAAAARRADDARGVRRRVRGHDMGHGDRACGLPHEVLARINTDCVTALRRPDVIEQHKVLGPRS